MGAGSRVLVAILLAIHLRCVVSIIAEEGEDELKLADISHIGIEGVVLAVDRRQILSVYSSAEELEAIVLVVCNLAVIKLW